LPRAFAVCLPQFPFDQPGHLTYSPALLVIIRADLRQIAAGVVLLPKLFCQGLGNLRKLCKTCVPSGCFRR